MIPSNDEFSILMEGGKWLNDFVTHYVSSSRIPHQEAEGGMQKEECGKVRFSTEMTFLVI